MPTESTVDLKPQGARKESLVGPFDGDDDDDDIWLCYDEREEKEGCCSKAEKQDQDGNGDSDGDFEHYYSDDPDLAAACQNSNESFCSSSYLQSGQGFDFQGATPSFPISDRPPTPRPQPAAALNVCLTKETGRKGKGKGKGKGKHKDVSAGPWDLFAERQPSPLLGKRKLQDSGIEKENFMFSPSPQQRHRQSLASTPAASSWSDLIREHQTLMESKGKVHGRHFNKSALALLDACVQMVKKESAILKMSPQPPPSTSGLAGTTLGIAEAISAKGVDTTDWTDEKEALSNFRSLLLNSRELASEELVARVVEYIQQGLSPFLTADEKKETLLRKSLAFLQELSPALSLKTAPVVKSYVSRLFDSQLDSLFAEIQMPEMSVREKSLLYRRMFGRFIDDETCVSFAVANRRLLGKLTPAEMWFATFFVFVTSRRVRADNLLMLGCVGESSSLTYFFSKFHSCCHRKWLNLIFSFSLFLCFRQKFGWKISAGGIGDSDHGAPTFVFGIQRIRRQWSGSLRMRL